MAWPKYFSAEYFTLKVLENGNLYELRATSSGIIEDFVANLGTPAYVEVAASGKCYMLAVTQTDGSVRSWMRIHSVKELPIPQIPIFRAACFFNGQLILGGITPGCDPNFNDLGPAYVAWSGVGRLEFRILEDKTAGYRPVPWMNQGQGTIFQMGLLGTGVVVFGDGGIGMLSPISEPVSGYGFTELTNPGIARPGLAAGNAGGWLYINQDYELVAISPDGQVQILGYDEFIAPMFSTGGADVDVSYDVKDGRWFISNASKCYCFNGQGLFETHQRISSVAFLGHTRIATFTEPATPEYAWGFTTSEQDLDKGSFKSVESIEVNLTTDGEGSILGRLSGTYSHSGDFIDTPLVNLGPEAIFYSKITSSKYKVHVRGVDNGFKRLLSIKPRIKFSDRRMVRGLSNANSADS